MGNLKSITLEAVKEQFCVSDKEEAMKMIRERLESVWDYERAAELTAKIGKQAEEAATAEGVTMPAVDRLIWAIKEAFILGSLDMAETMMSANDMGYQDLARKTRRKSARRCWNGSRRSFRNQKSMKKERCSDD